MPSRQGSASGSTSQGGSSLKPAKAQSAGRGPLRPSGPFGTDNSSWSVTQPDRGASTMHPLCPPKPKLFDRTGPGTHSRGASRTMSRWISGSCCSRPTVGGITRRSIDMRRRRLRGSRRSERMTGYAFDGGDYGSGPAEDLVDGLGFGHVVGGVDVPWAFTWAISPAASPASSRASSMHPIAPAPPGAGAVM